MESATLKSKYLTPNTYERYLHSKAGSLFQQGLHVKMIISTHHRVLCVYVRALIFL